MLQSNFVTKLRTSGLVTHKFRPPQIDHDATPSYILGKLQDFKSSEHRCRAYNYVDTQLVHVYEHLYSKAPRPLRSIPNHWFVTWEQQCRCSQALVVLM